MKKNGARCKLHLAIYGELLYDMKAVKNGMTFGDIAQLVERCVRNAEVRGSSPLISTRCRTVVIRTFVSDYHRSSFCETG